MISLSLRAARTFARFHDRVLSRPLGRHKPWNAWWRHIPRTVYDARGMIGAEERRALYWIGRDAFVGEGAIIDAGAYIGASAFCLAAGLADNPRAGSRRPIVYSYDYFRAMDSYVAEHISREVRSIEVGDDYLDIWRQQVGAHVSYIEPIQGDFLKARWTGAPIEILFIDVAKTQELNAHVLREFVPYLIPGRSLVVHQDFYHGWHPYIHVTMEALRDYLEVVDGLIPNQARLYRLKAPIPDKVLARIADYDFSPEERLDFIDSFAARETGDMRAMADVVRICQFTLDGNEAAKHTAYQAFLRTYENVWPKGLWWEQAHDIAEYRI